MSALNRILAGGRPVAMAGLMSLHMWRVRKDGGLAAQDQSPNIPAANPTPNPTNRGVKESLEGESSTTSTLFKVLGVEALDTFLPA